MSILSQLFDSNEKQLKKLQPVVEQVNVRRKRKHLADVKKNTCEVGRQKPSKI